MAGPPVASAVVPTQVPPATERESVAGVITESSDLDPSASQTREALGNLNAMDNPLTRRELAERAQASSVAIRGGSHYGAGVVLDDQGHILTAWHVVEKAPALRVYTLGGGNFPAQLVDHDEELDLALLVVSSEAAAQLTPAQLGSVTNTHVGADVLAVGSPRKMYFTVSRGMISYVGRSMGKVRYLQTDIPINSGNSGGPLLNSAGDVIGLVSFILRESQGISFAIPIDYALERFEGVLGDLKGNLHERAGAFRKWRRAYGGEMG